MQTSENTKREFVLNFRVSESEKKKIKVMEHLKNQSLRDMIIMIAEKTTDNLDIDIIYSELNKPVIPDIEEIAKMNKKDKKIIIKRQVKNAAEMYLNSTELLFDVPLDLIDD